MKMLNDPSPNLMPSEDLTTETVVDVDKLIVSDVEDISDSGEDGSHYSPTSQGTILLHKSYLYHHKTTFF